MQETMKVKAFSGRINNYIIIIYIIYQCNAVERGMWAEPESVGWSPDTVRRR